MGRVAHLTLASDFFRFPLGSPSAPARPAKSQLQSGSRGKGQDSDFVGELLPPPSGTGSFYSPGCDTCSPPPGPQFPPWRDLRKKARAGSQVFWPYLVSVSPSIMGLKGLLPWPVGKARLLAQTACWFGHQPLLPPHHDPLTRATTIDQPDCWNPCLRLWLLGGCTAPRGFPWPCPIPILLS